MNDFKDIRITGIDVEGSGKRSKRDSDIREIAFELCDEAPEEWYLIFNEVIKAKTFGWLAEASGRRIVLYGNTRLFGEDDLENLKRRVHHANEAYRQERKKEEAAREKLRQLAGKVDFD